MMMKTFIIVALLATTASAQPAATPPVSDAEVELPQGPPQAYLALDTAIGGDIGIGGYTGAGLELGKAIDHDRLWWAHAAFSIGGEWHDGFETDAMTRVSSRFVAGAGVELRPCVLGGGACAIAGVDLGVRHAGGQLEPVAIERLGLDLGTRNVRFRPGIAVDSSASAVVDGVALTAGVAYLW